MMRSMRTTTMMIHDRISQVYRVCYMFVLGLFNIPLKSVKRCFHQALSIERATEV